MGGGGKECVCLCARGNGRGGGDRVPWFRGREAWVWNALTKNLHVKDIIYENCWGGWLERRGMVLPPHPPMKIVFPEDPSHRESLIFPRKWNMRHMISPKKWEMPKRTWKTTILFFSSIDNSGSMSAVNWSRWPVPNPSYTHHLRSATLSSKGSKYDKINLLFDENIPCFLLRI